MTASPDTEPLDRYDEGYRDGLVAMYEFVYATFRDHHALVGAFTDKEALNIHRFLFDIYRSFQDDLRDCDLM